MPTVARHAVEEERRAWRDYAQRLEGLEGPEYDSAEQDAWDELQATLHAIGPEPERTDDPFG